MFNFLKTKRTIDDSLSLVLPITTDIHSHILPGIDDGSPDIETSLQLIQGLYNLGIRKAIATPHIIGDMYRNTPAIINTALAKTKDAVKEAGIDIELHAAAEYMLDDYFMELLKKKERLLTLQDNILLTEISYTTPPGNLQEFILNILNEGYLPILAHPERYHFYHKDYDEYHRLSEMGFILQVNLLSLTGYYGKSAKKAAVFIVENGLAKLAGTDMHHQQHLDNFKDPKNMDLIKKYLGDMAYNDLGAFSKT